MSQKISRRQFAVRGAVGIAAVAAPGLLLAQTPPKEPPPPVSDAELQAIEKQLAKPLTEEARKLLKTAVEESKKSSIKRKKTRITDSTEPCFLFIPPPREQVRP
ncbi:MAG: hypothetical protein HYR64_07800 [Fimbriimonas ginsengisoli]|uniref:Twin-arginine translocation signal domain-containing protein n=1 Tax=Fimbriimonas ginsengisoli TaxID=1005039 RepID=A0A931LVL1_FIMGI|nr:hypothetical protein [Fimbriimonas ginsengisoli]